PHPPTPPHPPPPHTPPNTHPAPPPTNPAPDPQPAGNDPQGHGWKSAYRTGKAAHAITSGLEVTWKTTPTQSSHNYF
ncbi:hypothetical protein AAHH80_33860, partial [Burkholderia pseudomallei]